MTDRNELERLQPMTTEQKALTLVNEMAASKGMQTTVRGLFTNPADLILITLQAAIEAHEADKKAFSNAAVKARDWLDPIGQKVGYHLTKPISDALSPFILPEPEPDPLVELMAFNGLDEALAEQRATNLRKDAADLGYKIILERIEQ